MADLSIKEPDLTAPVQPGRFFLPGPTEVESEVLAAMDRPIIGHRGPEIRELIAGMQPGLATLFGTERPVYLSTSSATGMMEAAVTNLSRRRILCLVCGAFSQRFYDVAEACGRPADRLLVEWGEPSLPEDLMETLTAQPDRYDLVTVVHSETSTGVLNPVREIGAVVGEFEDILLAVDTVSSLGGTPLRCEEWGLDFVLTGSQKALALPPGLALAVAGERALERAERVESRGYYFDLLKFERLAAKLTTPNTPVVSLLYALERQLERIRAEGLANRWARHAQLASRTQSWVDELAERTGRSYEVLAPAGYRSPTVTAVRLPDPDRIDGPTMAARLRERGYVIGSGYGKLKAETIRIGHMGDHTLDQLEALLEELTEVLIP